MVYFLTGLTAGNSAGNRGGALNTGTEALVASGPLQFLAAWFCTL